jgi:hypothetical protein
MKSSTNFIDAKQYLPANKKLFYFPFLEAINLNLNEKPSRSTSSLWVNFFCAIE